MPDLLADQKFGVIVLDPPWNYKNFSKVKHGAAVAHYKTMTMADLKKIPVDRWMADDCVVVLWGTWPKLPEALELLKAYGVDYITGFPWVKVLPEIIESNFAEDFPDIENEITFTLKDLMSGFKSWWKKLRAKVWLKIRRGIGFWTQSASEIVIIAVKGNPKRRDARDETLIGLLHGEDRVFYHPIQEHSKKPEDIQSWLERRADGPYLELFATRERENWTCIGYNTGFRLTENGAEPFIGEMNEQGHVQPLEASEALAEGA